MRMPLAQALQQVAKSDFAVGDADRQIICPTIRGEALEVAVMCEDPVLAPQFAHEGVAVGDD